MDAKSKAAGSERPNAEGRGRAEHSAPPESRPQNPAAAAWFGVDFRLHPELYRVGKGEQGVLTAEPYKSELLPHWRFRTPEIARASAEKLFSMYQGYKAQGDFVGMDMARKFLQMGYTRSKRYARHKSGKKYDGPVPPDRKGQSGAWGRAELPLDPDPVKAESAEAFRPYYVRVKEDPDYLRMKTAHQERYERKP